MLKGRKDTMLDMGDALFGHIKCGSSQGWGHYGMAKTYSGRHHDQNFPKICWHSFNETSKARTGVTAKETSGLVSRNLTRNHFQHQIWLSKPELMDVQCLGQWIYLCPLTLYISTCDFKWIYFATEKALRRPTLQAHAASVHLVPCSIISSSQFHTAV